MRRLGRLILVLVVMICFSGCTLHFKATDLELDAERQRVKTNDTYDLVKVTAFHGKAR